MKRGKTLASSRGTSRFCTFQSKASPRIWSCCAFGLQQLLPRPMAGGDARARVSLETSGEGPSGRKLPSAPLAALTRPQEAQEAQEAQGALGRAGGQAMRWPCRGPRPREAARGGQRRTEAGRSLQRAAQACRGCEGRCTSDALPRPFQGTRQWPTRVGAGALERRIAVQRAVERSPAPPSHGPRPRATRQLQASSHTPSALLHLRSLCGRPAADTAWRASTGCCCAALPGSVLAGGRLRVLRVPNAYRSERGPACRYRCASASASARALIGCAPPRGPDGRPPARAGRLLDRRPPVRPVSCRPFVLSGLGCAWAWACHGPCPVVVVSCCRARHRTTCSPKSHSHAALRASQPAAPSPLIPTPAADLLLITTSTTITIAHHHTRTPRTHTPRRFPSLRPELSLPHAAGLCWLPAHVGRALPRRGSLLQSTPASQRALAGKRAQRRQTPVVHIRFRAHYRPRG